MEKIKKIVSSVWFIPAISILLLSLIIFFAGPYIAFAGYYPLSTISSRIIVIISILLIYFLIQLVKYHLKVKNQQKMVDDIADDNGINDVINAESAELKDKFNQAFDLLKNNKTGPSSLTELPWYMIIGSPGSGKTTLLANSGLKFPLFNEFSNQAVKGVGGTKNCDWWITQEAVLLDTAGRYSSQDSHQKADQSGWNNFLGLIKKYRKKPISGLLVSFSMSDLMTLSEYELSQQVMQMKKRIAEVNDYFSTKFPVYIVITKSDMVAGFSQFYETFSHKEREQTFGITFDKKESLLGDLLTKFSHEFKLLTQSITRRQWQRISLERDPGRKSIIYSFSDQFSSLEPCLANIIENLSKQDDGLTTGIVRGLYFTSGTQYGAPIDRIVAKVSQAFGLKSTAKALWNNDQRSYFIKELLQQVVFPESEQFGVMTGHDNRKTIIKKIVVATAGVVALALCIGLYVSYSNNARYISVSEQSVDNWSKQYENSSASSDIRHYIPALNDFSNNISALVEQNNEQFSGLGLAQSGTLEGALTASYKRLLKTVLLPYVQSQIEQQLNIADNANEKYQALKAYLMLGNTKNRDDVFLKYWLDKNLNNNEFFTESEFVQLSAHAENLVSNNMAFDVIDNTLVADARISLQSQPVADIYYQQFKTAHINNSAEMLSMAQLAGTDWRIVLETKRDDILTISRLFTPEILSKVIKTDINKYVGQLNNESWLLGEGNIINKASLAKKIEATYARDYVKNWQEVLHSITIKKSNNIEALNSALAITSSVESPLFLLLDTVSQATKLVDIGPTSQKVDLSLKGEDSSALNKSDLRNNDTPEYFITSQFSKLHELMKKDRKTVVQQRMSAIVSEISIALNHANKSEEISSTDDNTLNSLEAFAYVQIEPLNVWGAQLANNIKEVKSQTHRIKMAKIWEQDVFAQCNDTISFKYPFDKSSRTDASLRDLTQVFGGSGPVYQFFIEHIEPLIKSKAYPWQWKSTIASTYGFNDQVLPFFEKISKVRDSLFVVDNNRARLDLLMKPIYLDSRLAKFKMSLYGQNLSYQFGRPTTTTVSWPPESSMSTSQFNFVRRDGSELTESQSGMFALFRLMDKSDINRVNENKVEVTFFKNDFKSIYEISGKGRSNPVIFSQLSNFKCLPKL